MHDNDNIWKDRFNDTSLNQESWLEPGDHVLASVMQQIDKPKRRSLVWLLWLLFAFSIGMAAYVSFLMNQDTKLDNTLLEKSSSPTLLTQQISADDNLSLSEAPITEEKIMLPDDLEPSNNHIPASHLRQAKKEKSNTNLSNKSGGALSETPMTSQNLEVNQVILSEQSTQIFKREYVSTMENLPLIPLELFAAPVTLRQPSLVLDINKIEPLTQLKKYSFGMIAGVSLWNFSLNNNYSSALSPADFTFDQGESFSYGLVYNTQISRKMSLEFQAIYESVEFHSSHNSMVTYHSSEEMNGDANNSFDIAMASPVGFLSSHLTVERRTSEELPPTDLIIDLHNTHRLKNLDIQAMLVHDLLKMSSLDFRLLTGVGMNNFFSLSNSLDSYGINNSAFSSGYSVIDTDQMNLNQTNFYGSLGLRMNYHLSDTYKVGFSGMYKQNIDVIYKELDFNTQLSRYFLAVDFVKKF